MTTHDWSDEWPTEPGWYWFHGVFSDMNEAPIRMEPMCVRRAVNAMVYICGGTLVDAREGARGHFLPLRVPFPPHVTETTAQ